MDKLKFFISNLVACFVITSDGRHYCRAMVNMFLYRGQIKRFLRDAFGVRLTSLRFVRQHTLNRAVFLANDRYYVKVFRDVSPKQMRGFAFLVEYIRQNISICVPPIIASSRYHMYICERVAGRPIVAFSPDDVRPHADKICAQVARFIDELQSINVEEIPDNTRFETPMQRHHVSAPVSSSKRVLEHFDLSDTNIFLNQNMDVCAVIDWDTVYISRNPNADWEKFLMFFNAFLEQKNG